MKSYTAETTKSSRWEKEPLKDCDVLIEKTLSNAWLLSQVNSHFVRPKMDLKYSLLATLSLIPSCLYRTTAKPLLAYPVCPAKAQIPVVLLVQMVSMLQGFFPVAVILSSTFQISLKSVQIA